ncbi:TRM11 family SAM-dependent methyltransferase [Paenibacillus wulumuqiensis]|uniref:TRM11 family SAM-dependent methyltransferase n=1 Tax=Paenibacillus wulumuqiensis TaxID=1567107 RepID=UPI000A8AFE83|nr:RNA methyltransferase [Paenibacillus wulumuqiensis]
MSQPDSHIQPAASQPLFQSTELPVRSLDDPFGYIYTYACHEDEQELCHLELRCLLGQKPEVRHVESVVQIPPERSPFIHYRLDIQCEAANLEQLEQAVEQLDMNNRTFKLISLDAEQTFTYDEKRQLERRIGMHITGKAQMKQPQQLIGMTYAGGRWVAGRCHASESVWLRHNDKPRHYSTALSTRVARAAVNIAVPDTAASLIDPCCGIGTVLIEAMSMGITVTGYDLNPLAVQGARENLTHYSMPDIVSLADMRKLTGRYDALILDLPYNLCSVLNEQERLNMLLSAARLAGRVLVISTEAIESSIEQAGMQILEVCHIRKGHFTRYLWLCESVR